MKTLTKIILVGFCLILLYHCGRTKSMEDLLVDPSCGEWKLEKAKLGSGENAILNDGNRLYLVFSKDGIYDMYHRKKGKKYYLGEDSDLVIERKWSIDSTNELHLSSFEQVKLVKLIEDTLAFRSGKTVYYFARICR